MRRPRNPTTRTSSTRGRLSPDYASRSEGPRPRPRPWPWSRSRSRPQPWQALASPPRNLAVAFTLAHRGRARPALLQHHLFHPPRLPPSHRRPARPRCPPAHPRRPAARHADRGCSPRCIRRSRTRTSRARQSGEPGERCAALGSRARHSIERGPRPAVPEP